MTIATIGSLGDLHPQIAIAIELRRRGHQITFATHQEYRTKIELLGFEFHPLRPQGDIVSNPAEVARMMDLKTGSEYVVRKWLLPNLRDTYADLLDSAKNADFMIAGEVVYAAPLVSEQLGIKWASSALAPIAFFSAYDPPVIPLFPLLSKLRGLGLTFNRGVMQLLRSLTKSWGEPIHRFRAELELAPLTENPIVNNRSPYLVLAMFSSLLAKPQPDWAKNTIVTGFTFYDGSETQSELTPEIQQFLEIGTPPIIFTLGSAAVMTPGNFYRESIQAAKQLNRRAILLIGENTPPENLSTEIIAVKYLPYSLIFPRAAAIVHQGGIGTTAQALRSGRPTLIMPYSYDQPDNAARVERLGTSRTISRDCYLAPRVANELQELLENPSYAAKSAAIGHILQSENGAVAACDAIERQLERG
jgi:rhamnosyltransferase subunit B